MTILKDVFSELLGMFVGDVRLSGAVLAVVAVAAALIDLIRVDPLVGGGVLLIGNLAVVLVAVRLTARAKWAGNANGMLEHAATPAANRRPGDDTLARAVMWLDRLRQRRALKELDDRLLDDIGVSKEAAEVESRRFD